MDVTHMQTFVAVVEETSFTAAAARLGIAKSVCSRRISDLETDLGAQLVLRTTRSVVPTDIGVDYYTSCLDILARIDAANALARKATETVAGRLRLSLPFDFTEIVLTPSLEQFSAAHPEVELVLHLSDQRVDLISQGFDAAVRIGQLEDSGLFAKKIGETAMLLVGAPDYLDRHGTPEQLADLGNHDVLRYTNVASGADYVAFKDGQELRKRVSGPIASNSGRFNLSMVLAGRGLTLAPDFIVSNDLAAGRLIRVLPDHDFATNDIHVVYAQKTNMPASLRAFIDFLAPK